MLVLSRKVGEKIDLYYADASGTIQKICVTVVRSKGEVRLGFEAKPNVAILRTEVPDDGRVATKCQGSGL